MLVPGVSSDTQPLSTPPLFPSRPIPAPLAVLVSADGTSYIAKLTEPEIQVLLGQPDEIGQIYHPHFTDRKMVANKSQVTCPVSQAQNQCHNPRLLALSL